MIKIRSTAVLMIGALLLAGVGCGSENKQSSASPSTPVTTSSVDGVEVKSTPCAEPADDAAAKNVATSNGLRGTIAVRKSLASKAECDRYYWARFQPEGSSKGAFTVTFQKGDTKAPVQASEPQQPTWAAFTVGYHGKVGEKLIACVVPAGGSPVCAETTVV